MSESGELEMVGTGVIIVSSLLFTELLKFKKLGTSLAVQWLGLCAFTAEGKGSIPGWGTKIPRASWRGQKK